MHPQQSGLEDEDHRPSSDEDRNEPSEHWSRCDEQKAGADRRSPSYGRQQT